MYENTHSYIRSLWLYILIRPYKSSLLSALTPAHLAHWHVSLKSSPTSQAPTPAYCNKRNVIAGRSGDGHEIPGFRQQGWSENIPTALWQCEDCICWTWQKQSIEKESDVFAVPVLTEIHFAMEAKWHISIVEQEILELALH